MNNLLSDVFTVVGLAFTALGASVTARSIILSEAQAISIGVSRICGNTDEENLTLPTVRNLLAASKAAQWGLWIVVVGTGLQLVPVVARLFF